MVIPSYDYDPLPHSSALRILKLQPAPLDQPAINCELPVFWQKDIEKNKIKYEALTWCWGQGAFDYDIRIHVPLRDGTESQMFVKKISRSLYEALRALRQTDKTRSLWVDAICINQNEIVERNQQVPRMDVIYGMATNVCVWLGPEDEHSKVALEFIKTKLLDLWSFDELCTNVEYAKKWEALVEVMKRPWFSRRWVVQEISLAISAQVYCGRRHVDWNEFSDAVSLFMDAEADDKRLSEVIRKHEGFGHVPQFFGDVSSLGAALLVDTTRNLFRTAGRKRIGLSTLENLVSRLSIFDVSDPRDAIYALLAVSRDSNPKSDDISIPDFSDHYKYKDDPQGGQHAVDVLKNLRRFFPQWRSEEYIVDYSRDVIDVFREFISFSVRKADQTRALDILCRPWAPQHDQPLGALFQSSNHQQAKTPLRPSWIRRTDKAPHVLEQYRRSQYEQNQAGSSTPTTILRMQRQYADSLVGMPDSSQGNYSAAGTRTLNRMKLEFKRRENSYSMFVEGFVLDVLEVVEEGSQTGNIPWSWLKYAGWKDKSVDPPPSSWERFWETLVASRGPNGQNPPTFYPRACLQVLRDHVTERTIDTSALINNGPGSIVSKFLRRVQATIWERKLVQTRKNRLGLVDRDAKKDDLVCVLYGCSVPVVLRRHPVASSSADLEDSEKARERWRERVELIRRVRASRRTGWRAWLVRKFPRLRFLLDQTWELRTIVLLIISMLTALDWLVNDSNVCSVTTAQMICPMASVALLPCAFNEARTRATLLSKRASTIRKKHPGLLAFWTCDFVLSFVVLILSIQLRLPVGNALSTILCGLVINYCAYKFGAYNSAATKAMASGDPPRRMLRSASISSVESNSSETTLVGAEDTAHEPSKSTAKTTLSPRLGQRKSESQRLIETLDLGETTQSACYTLIGECYIHGMMNGEAIAWQNERQTQIGRNITEIFDIR